MNGGELSLVVSGDVGGEQSDCMGEREGLDGWGWEGLGGSCMGEWEGLESCRVSVSCGPARSRDSSE